MTGQMPLYTLSNVITLPSPLSMKYDYAQHCFNLSNVLLLVSLYLYEIHTLKPSKPTFQSEYI